MRSRLFLFDFFLTILTFVHFCKRVKKSARSPASVLKSPSIALVDALVDIDACSFLTPRIIEHITLFAYREPP